ncbi:hypothetical protein TWF718_005905 [Orbilia javanica]
MCRKDCKCSACSRCHTCWLRIIETSFQASPDSYYDSWEGKPVPVCKTYEHDCLAGMAEGDKSTPAAGKSSWESFVRLRGTSPRNSLGFRRFSQSGITTIYLSKEQLTYKVHRQLLIEESLFFAALLLPGSFEQETTKVSLSRDVDTQVAFERFMQWCYFGYYINDPNQTPLLSIDAAVYAFAQRIRCYGLRDFALKQAEAICSSVDKAVTKANLSELPDTIKIIYASSASMDDGLDSDDECVSQQIDSKLPLKEKAPTAKAVGNKGPQDGFRRLLASVSARHIVKFREEPAFMKVHRSLSDFAADVLFFVSQSSDTGAKQSSSCIIS